MRRPAFTLIEMLIVIALIVIIASISLGAFRSARDQANFKKAVNDTVSLIEKARNMALNSEQVEVDGVNEVVSGGYGIAVEGTDSVVLFAETSVDGEYTAADLLIDEVTFATGVTVMTEDRAAAIYTPPLADLEITGTSTTDFTITITSDATGKNQTVSLNKISRVPEVGAVSFSS